MKPLSLILVLLSCAACTEIPELEGSSAASVRKAPYPRLLPVSDTLGPPTDVISEAAEVEEELNARSEALAEKAQALQEVEND